jgi:ribosomal protein S18 acetylase RimI-like enzyme
MPVTLRPVVQSDEDFLFEVYASTRREEMNSWGWDASQQDAFLKMQFMAQKRSYEMQHANSSHDIILNEGVPVGRFLVARTSEEIHLVDISLMPEARGNGIGTALIKELLNEGVNTSLPVRLEVLQTNPAAVLYERLGFGKTGENSLYFQMEKRPTKA